jgi:hypothetical protein
MDSDTRNWLLDHHRESYRYQITQRDKVYDRVSFLSGPLTLLGGGISYALFNYPNQSNAPFLLFYVPICLSGFCLLIAVCLIIYCLVRGLKYLSILTPAQLRDYAKQLSAYASADAGRGVNVLDKIKENLADRYCDAATHNFQVNYRRGNIILWATKISATALLLLLISLPAFFLAKSKETVTPMKIIIENPVRIEQ